MSDKPQFEFPEAVRELAERNVEQARSAYNQFIDMARKVQETLSASQGAMTSGATEMQTQIAKFAEQNIQASFSFASSGPCLDTWSPSTLPCNLKLSCAMAAWWFCATS